MNGSNLSPQERRTIALSGLVIGAAFLFRFAALPYAEAEQETRARLVRERDLLRREQGLIAVAEGYSGAIQEASTRLFEIAPRLISGTTYTSAQAALARALDPAAAGAVTLGQVELLPIRSAGEGLVALPLRVQGEGDLEGLLSLLGTLEAGPVLLHVEDLEMDGRERPLLDSPELASAPETLSFRFTLVGFSLADVPGAADGDAPPEEEGGSSSPRREP